MRIESISLDKCITMTLLEAATSKHKTSMTKETKTMLLPFTSLGRCLGSANWAESFMDARSQSGLHGQDLFYLHGMKLDNHGLHIQCPQARLHAGFASYCPQQVLKITRGSRATVLNALY